jgi:hypothetical protein
MSRKPPLPDNYGYGVTFEHFSALITPRELEKIELTLSETMPSETSATFRGALIQYLWFFYGKSVPVSAAMFDRAALTREFRKAARLAKQLEASADRIWRSRDPEIFHFQSRFVGISAPPESDEWQPMHPSGVLFVDMLSEFARAASREADKLDKDKGGRRPFTPFDELLIALVRAQTKLASPGNDLFRFVVAVADLLREIQGKLPSAKFKIPKKTAAERNVRDRLRSILRLPEFAGPTNNPSPELQG